MDWLQIWDFELCKSIYVNQMSKSASKPLECTDNDLHRFLNLDLWIKIINYELKVGNTYGKILI